MVISSIDDLPKSKYGLPEFTFENGSIDDSSEPVAVVGQEYSSVNPWDVFHSKEDVETYISEKEEQHKHEVSLLLVRLAEKDKKIAALMAKYRGCKRELDLLKDTQSFYKGQ